MRIINSTSNGQIFVCTSCNKLHLEFGNLFLHFTYDELRKFVEYINSIDFKFYLEKNINAQNRRKLVLQIGFKDIHLALNPKEFVELKELLSLKRQSKFINNEDLIDFTMVFN